MKTSYNKDGNPVKREVYRTSDLEKLLVINYRYDKHGTLCDLRMDGKDFSGYYFKDARFSLHFNENGTTVIFSSPCAKKVSAITLTSPATDNTLIDMMTVYGANDNGEWEILGSFDDIAFEWARFTRPFLLKDAKPYQHYMINLVGAKSLAEIELLGE